MGDAKAVSAIPRPPSRLTHSDQFVRLDAESPLRMPQAILDRALGIGGDVRAVHGLQEEMLKLERREFFGQGILLWVNEL